MNKIEVTAKNVEEALTQAMIELGTTSDKMEYEVSDAGKTGFFGILSRPAVIRAWVKEDAFSEELENFMNSSSKTSAPAVETVTEP